MIQSVIVKISLNSPDYAGLSYEHFEITSLREKPYQFRQHDFLSYYLSQTAVPCWVGISYLSLKS